MAFLVNRNLAQVFAVAGVTLLMLTYLHATSKVLKVWMVICLVAAGIEFLFLTVNPWAFLGLALSPLPFYLAIWQGRAENPLFLLTFFLLVFSSVFLFAEHNDGPTVVSRSAVIMAILSGSVIWIASQGLRSVEGARAGLDPDSVVGLTGETLTDIGRFPAGLVRVNGELWQARSKKPISAGSMVRVLRQDGFWLTVKEVGKSITKQGDHE